MEELRNLKELAKNASIRFLEYEGVDFVLPQIFKDNIKEISNSTISYKKYSSVVKTSMNQNIYMSNQWFYIASYFTDFYNELIKYKNYALKVSSIERLKSLNGASLNETENSAIEKLPISPGSKDYLRKFITDYKWWHGGKTINRADFYISPIMDCACLVNASQSYIADLCAFLADKPDLVKAIEQSEERASRLNKETCGHSLQQIFYGAPGTGKSHEIKEILKKTKSDYIRTTFHPDSDYSTFVGAYKPTSEDTPIRDYSGKVVKKDNSTEPVTEKRIVYEFVPQAFLQAYVAAWKKYREADSMADGQPQSEFLVIEEINRGNCAQIFGDLFQLLDRGDSGFSEYYITADSDMQKYLRGQFKDLDLSAVEGTLNCLFESENVAERIKDGSILLLPNNLYIWATMNTSDQSLFPIDSAFKRRWDWKYMPIADAKKEYVISNNGSNYDWWQFLEAINKHIFEATQSEDKKMGYFFCKPKGKEIDAEMFVGKVVFYLWNDVFKDTEFSDGIFNDGENGKLTFDRFYTVVDKETKADPETVKKFLENLGISAIPKNDTNGAENVSKVPAESKENN